MGIFSAVAFNSSYEQEGGNFIVASGGETFDSGSYRYHKFTTTGTTDTTYTFSVYGTGSAPNNYIELLAVAGGGGGNGAGGAGAGGVVYITASHSESLDVGYYQIQVGGGGASKQFFPNPTPDIEATKGGDTFMTSSLPGTFNIIAKGGGVGVGVYPNSLADGGSGAGVNTNPQTSGGSEIQSLQSGLSSTYGYGNDGGGAGTGVIGVGGGGGGGASQTGSDAYFTEGGDGGDGILVEISGSYYVGGGGGGAGTDSPGNEPTFPGASGLGGGGRGSYTGFGGGAGDPNRALSGVDGLGGGAGQMAYTTGLENEGNGFINGGCGILIIRYKFQ